MIFAITTTGGSGDAVLNAQHSKRARQVGPGWEMKNISKLTLTERYQAITGQKPCLNLNLSRKEPFQRTCNCNGGLHFAKRRVPQVAKSAMDLKRDLAQANDRSLVFNAEQHPNMDKAGH